MAGTAHQRNAPALHRLYARTEQRTQLGRTRHGAVILRHQPVARQSAALRNRGRDDLHLLQRRRPFRVPGVTEVKREHSLGRNHVGRTWLHRKGANGRDEWRLTPRQLLEGEDQLGGARECITPQRHRRGSRVPGFAPKREASAGLSRNLGYNADRQILRLEDRPLLNMHLDITQKFPRPMGRSGQRQTAAIVPGERLANTDAIRIAQGEVFGALAGGAMAYGLPKISDRRLKENIEVVGHDVRTDLPLYEFEYIGGTGQRFLGVMADDVEKRFPSMVVTMSNGYKAVNYAGLGIEMLEV